MSYSRVREDETEEREMKLRWNWALAALACLMLVACSNANNLDTNGVKPDRDPDEGLVDNGKTDTLSNWYTTIVANIDVPGKYAGAISYPDWFHGVTLTLKAGDEVIQRGARSLSENDLLTVKNETNG